MEGGRGKKEETGQCLCKGNFTICSLFLSASANERTDLISTVCFFTKSSSRFTSWSLRCFFSSVCHLILRRSSSYCCFMDSVSTLACFLVYKRRGGLVNLPVWGEEQGTTISLLCDFYNACITDFTASFTRCNNVYKTVYLIFIRDFTLSTTGKGLFGIV